MRLKTFHGTSMHEVMGEVRATLGPDAIIISSDESPAGVRVTAALEAEPTPPPAQRAPEAEQTPTAYEITHPVPVVPDFDMAELTAILQHHAVPPATASRLMEAAGSAEAASLVAALKFALEACLRFAPLTNLITRPVMLVGPGGVGKTVSAAKIAASALLARHRVRLITTDTIKAGGVAQLDHFAQLMKQTVQTASTPQELATLAHTGPSAEVTVIDTFGANPFEIDELGQLLKFVRAVDAEPVLVMPAGLDASDAADIADVFARLGCQRFIATRLDGARRYGGVVTAARPGRLSLAAVSRSPYVAEGLEPASAESFARLLAALPSSRPSQFLSEAS